MTDNLVICKKLEVLVTYYQGLAELTTGLTQEEYQRNLLIRRAIEREIQLIVECATDINNIILKKLQGAPAKDYFNSFIDLAENEVIDMDFPLAIAPLQGCATSWCMSINGSTIRLYLPPLPVSAITTGSTLPRWLST